MTNEENKISDMIDAGLVIRESIEELAAKCFVMPKNKKGEAITTPVGANPKGWKAHLKSFTKGYLARADERENKWIGCYEKCQRLLRSIISADTTGLDVVIADLKKQCEHLIESLPTPPKQ